MGDKGLQCSSQPGLAEWICVVVDECQPKEEVWTASTACVFTPAQMRTPGGSSPPSQQPGAGTHARKADGLCAPPARPAQPSEHRAEVHELPQPDSDDLNSLLCSNPNLKLLAHPFPSDKTPLLIAGPELHSCSKLIIQFRAHRHPVRPWESRTTRKEARYPHGSKQPPQPSTRVPPHWSKPEHSYKMNQSGNQTGRRRWNFSSPRA